MTESAGMTYVQIPMTTTPPPPHSSQISRIVNDPASRPVYSIASAAGTAPVS